MPRKPTVYVIPAGTKPRTCAGHLRGGTCDASIYWIKGPRTLVPISIDVEGGKAPSEASGTDDQEDLFGVAPPVHDGKGCSHFENCPDADLFSHNNRARFTGGKR